jgi:hypothetical protein
MVVPVVPAASVLLRVRARPVRPERRAHRCRVTVASVAPVARAVMVAVVAPAARVVRRPMVVLPVLPGRWAWALEVLLAVRAAPVVLAGTRRV